VVADGHLIVLGEHGRADVAQGDASRLHGVSRCQVFERPNVDVDAAGASPGGRLFVAARTRSLPWIPGQQSNDRNPWPNTRNSCAASRTTRQGAPPR